MHGGGGGAGGFRQLTAVINLSYWYSCNYIVGAGGAGGTGGGGNKGGALQMMVVDWKWNSSYGGSNQRI